jgi:hypothetical protein
MALGTDKHAETKIWIKRACQSLSATDIDWENASNPGRYNCFGFAVGIHKWWQPPERDRHGRIKNPRDHWPAGLPRNDTIEAYTKAAEGERFIICGPGIEHGFHKIVLCYFTEPDGIRRFTHAAQLLPNGNWKSKIGDLSDFEHPEQIGCDYHGDGRVYMRRTWSTSA